MRTLIFVALISVFLASCSESHKNTTHHFRSLEDKKDIELSLRHLLFVQSGIYTLLGSKPITTFEIEVTDREQYNQALLKHLENSTLESFQLYLCKDDPNDSKIYKSLSKTQKKKTFLFRESDAVFNVSSRWSTLSTFIKKHQLSRRYLLIEKKLPSDAPFCLERIQIFFVNVLKTACILEQNREIFEPVLGEKFNALEAVLGFKDPKSPLRNYFAPSNNVHHRELGILLGCDRVNAQIFAWREEYTNDTTPHPSAKLLQSLSTVSWDDELAILKKSHPYSAQNFPLPTFVSFFPLAVEKQIYETERQQIMNFYKKNDFLQSTLEILIEGL